MSALQPKNIQIYIVMAILFGGGTLFNQTNSGVTQDKIEGIIERVEKLEISHGAATKIGSDHQALFAHSGIFERTNQMQNIIDDLQDRILFLERQLISANQER